MSYTDIVTLAGYAVETVGVLVVIVGCGVSSASFLAALPGGVGEDMYRELRRRLARSIILGLEFLIAGDIIRTVVVADTLENVATLGLIILIRTFLGFTLHLETEGRWPWQGTGASG